MGFDAGMIWSLPESLYRIKGLLNCQIILPVAHVAFSFPWTPQLCTIVACSSSGWATALRVKLRVQVSRKTIGGRKLRTRLINMEDFNHVRPRTVKLKKGVHPFQSGSLVMRQRRKPRKIS